MCTRVVDVDAEVGALYQRSFVPAAADVWGDNLARALSERRARGLRGCVSVFELTTRHACLLASPALVAHRAPLVIDEHLDTALVAVLAANQADYDM